ncbi:OprD family outer membrane porin [Pseudomonas citronellolis]|uniref:OprD family outer membrane porin n=1 Tax=Pseudomonas citronellolis TaxID=53408 RepID=UPI0023E37548|nr:OprD family outer membrane porin [Pseudomonas citronellolis]MDF3934905.1 OprD family outer membrane porin [Pseudomonas citronellolis]
MIPSRIRPATLGLALAVGSSCPAWALEEDERNDQATAKGFLEGQSLTLSTRNFASREQKHGRFVFKIPKDNGYEPTHSRRAWVQGSILQYSSGYTQGPLGFGLDLGAFHALNLERGKGVVAGGSNRTLTDGDGRPLDEWSKLGIANLRLRMSNSELRAGRFRIDTPVLASNDNRVLPSTLRGIGLTSEEVNGLALQAGSFDRISPRTGAGDEKLTTSYGDRKAKGDRYSYLGGTYRATERLALTAYGGDFEDIWRQYYLGFAHRLGDPEVLALHTRFDGYSTRDSGSRKAGYIDNDTWSLAFTLARGAHSLMAGWQQVDGDEYFDYVNETAAIYLVNYLQSDYNGPNEKSAQLAFGTDWAPYGIPGLSSTLWYAKGWGIDGTRYAGDRNGAHGSYAEVRKQDGERHRELGLTVAYKFQDGPLKRSSVKLTYRRHRASQNQADGSIDDLRLITTLPFNLL